MDSQLIIRQLQGRYKVRNERLRPFFERILELRPRFGSFSMQHVPREAEQARRRARESRAGRRLTARRTTSWLQPVFRPASVSGSTPLSTIYCLRRARLRGTIWPTPSQRQQRPPPSQGTQTTVPDVSHSLQPRPSQKTHGRMPMPLHSAQTPVSRQRGHGAVCSSISMLRRRLPLSGYGPARITGPTLAECYTCCASAGRVTARVSA